MSELERCEVCGKQAYRYHSRLCPMGWLYGQATIKGDDGDADQDVVLMVCSPECAILFWTPGGKRGEIDRVLGYDSNAPPLRTIFDSRTIHEEHAIARKSFLGGAKP